MHSILLFSLLLLCTILSTKCDDTDPYAPNTGVICPSGVTFVRTFSPENQSISASESSYVQARASAASQSWKEWLGTGSDLGYDLSKFLTFPTLGIAFSGGGHRAALFGAGVIESFDGRNASSKSVGTGGLLQATTYVAGLSGGAWLTSSLTFKEYLEIRALVLGDSTQNGWLLNFDLGAPGGPNVVDLENQEFYNEILRGVMTKANKSLDTSITDIWAMTLSHHYLGNDTTSANFFANSSHHGSGTLWSQIPNLSSWQDHSMPFPIITTASRPSWSNSSGLQSLDSPVYEINPYEMGSFDPSLSAMTNITYVGTNFVNGQPANNSACVTGFDQAGFMIGSSSNLFNILFDKARNSIRGFPAVTAAGLLFVLHRVLSQVSTRKDDVANWPNPFEGIAPSTYQDHNSSWLDIIDGGGAKVNIPLDALFVKARNVDVIVAVEASADTDTNFPDGTTPVMAQMRLKNVLSISHKQFPPIPESTADFISTGVTQRPTFFGCEPQNPTSPEWPLLIYLPNAPPPDGSSPFTNTDTFKISYSQKQVDFFLNQAYNLSTSGFTPSSRAPDPNYGRCLQCAAIDRGRYKASPTISRSDFCSKCFTQYCFDPDHPPSASDIPARNFKLVDPDPGGVGSFFQRNKVPLIAGISGGAALIIGLIAFFCIRSSRKARQRGIYKKIKLDEVPPRSTYRMTPQTGI